jgi:hypothetical protein
MVSKEMQGVAAERQAWVETYCWLMQAMEEYEWPKLMPMTAPAASVMIVCLWYGGVETEGGSDGVGMDGAFSLGGGGGGQLGGSGAGEHINSFSPSHSKISQGNFLLARRFFSASVSSTALPKWRTALACCHALGAGL